VEVVKSFAETGKVFLLNVKSFVALENETMQNKKVAQQGKLWGR